MKPQTPTVDRFLPEIILLREHILAYIIFGKRPPKPLRETINGH
jgi:hypothetical protein